jgi:hypothetical protein
MTDCFPAVNSLHSASGFGRVKPIATAATANESSPPEAGGHRSDHFALARLDYSTRLVASRPSFTRRSDWPELSITVTEQ